MRPHLSRSLATGLTLAAAFAAGVFATAAPQAQGGRRHARPVRTGVQGAAHGGRQAGLQRHLAGDVDRQLEPEDHPAGPGVASAQIGIYGAEPPGLGVVEGGPIPYQPSALARKRANLAKRAVSDPLDRTAGDPEAKCYMPGIPRATHMPYPFQIVQGTDKLVFAYQFADTGRLVYLGTPPEAPADSWMGMSSAKFEGDTLVVTATDFNDETWLDRAGNYHSDALKVVERFTPASPYHLAYEATIEDPKVFTRPWKISMPLYRRMERNFRLLEFKWRRAVRGVPLRLAQTRQPLRRRVDSRM
ncbi:MAG: hypothetical protein AB7N65_16920 [Vicinamibacterales bacterium]